MDYVFFLPDIFGGVFSVVNQYANSLIKEKYCNTVTVVLTSIKESLNQDKVLDTYFNSSISVVRFSYSKFDNRYIVYKRLSRLVQNKSAVVICNDFLEVYMIANIQLPNPCFFIVHGDYNYYYKLAQTASGFIDHFFAVNPVIKEKLQIGMPGASVSTLRFLVKDNLFKREKFAEEKLNVIFVGRVSYAKGFDILAEIYKKLQAAGLPFQLTVIGALYEKDYKGFLSQAQITYIEKLENAELQKLMVDQHLLLLPSRAEGYPVTIVEAMKAGILPLVNDIPAMAPDILVNEETGIRIQENKPEVFCQEIMSLNQNRELLKEMSENAYSKVNSHFNNAINLKEFKKIINNIAGKRITKVYPKSVGRSNLDNPLIPNFVTNRGRVFIEYLKKWKVSL